jgi:uncharacterized protein with HEPN domain
MEHRDFFLVEVILDYCDRIMESVRDLDWKEFSDDLVMKDATALRVLQIGENAAHLSESFKTNHCQIPWHEIIGLRNVVAHEYGDIDDQVLWEIATIDIPKLRDYCAKIIGKE